MYKINITRINVVLFINSNFKYNNTIVQGTIPNSLIGRCSIRLNNKTEIETSIIKHESAFEEAVSSLLCNVNKTPSSRVVGIGIEKSFKASGTNGQNASKRVALLKLCSGTTCLILHLIRFKAIPISLIKFLDLSNLKFVGTNIQLDLAALKRDYGLRCRNVFELGSLVASCFLW